MRIFNKIVGADTEWASTSATGNLLTCPELTEFYKQIYI